ncbi:MAG: MMPL family transporter [Oscillospiraceae bacterium]|nr:MMPL family transporter [Oscillospiraceae bacterium]
MRKAANFIVNKRYLILTVVLTLTVICGWLITRVNINSDMTKYLADDSQMKHGADIIASDFPESDTSEVMKLMVNDLDDKSKLGLKEKLENIKDIQSVAYESDDSYYNKDNHTLFEISTQAEYGTPEEEAIETQIHNLVNDYDYIFENGHFKTGLPFWVYIVSFVVLTVILLIMCGSWFEPLIFLFVICTAIVINMGTNVFKPSVSSVTFSIAAILQVVLSMDYSIILMNRYRQELRKSDDHIEAMKNALTNAFSSISSSAFTTFVGLLMLVFMSFKIGADLGIVLAKGVICSLFCIFTILPGLILIFDKIIAKTSKPIINIPMNGISKLSYRSRKAAVPIFAVVLVGSYLLSTLTPIEFAMSATTPITEIFPANNTVVVLYNNEDEDKISALADRFSDRDYVRSSMSYPSTLGKEMTAGEMADSISELSPGQDIDEEMLKILYYKYYSGSDIPDVKLDDLINFICDDILTNKTFADKIDSSISDNIELLKKFSDAGRLKTRMTAEEMTGFFDISQLDKDTVMSLYMLYFSENESVDRGTMTITEFVNFLSKDILEDKTYSSMLSDDVKKQIDTLKIFADPQKSEEKLSTLDISKLIGIDEESVKLLFVYYNSLDRNYNPQAMTVTELVNFISDTASKNKLLSSYFDSKTINAVSELKTFTDINGINTQLTSSELSSRLSMDGSVTDLIYNLYFGSDATGKTMTLYQFTEFLSGSVLSNPAFAGAVDSSMSAQISDLNKMLSAAQSGTKFNSSQLSGILGTDSAVIDKLFILYASSNTDVSSQTMTLGNFISFLLAHEEMIDSTTYNQLITINHLILTAASGTSLTSAELSSVTGIDAASIDGILMMNGTDSMQLTDFLDLMTGSYAGSIDEGTLASLIQTNTLIKTAISGQQLSAAQISQALGMDETAAAQVFALKTGTEIAADMTMTLPEFTDFIVNHILTDPAYSSYFDNASASQITQVHQLISTAGIPMTSQQISDMLGLDKSMADQLFAVYSGIQKSDKTMSMQEFSNYLLSDIISDPAFSSQFDNVTVSKLTLMNNIMTASASGTKYSCTQMTALIPMDSQTLRLLYCMHDSSTGRNVTRLSIKELIGFINSNTKTFSPMLDKDRTQMINLADKIINACAQKQQFTPETLSELIGMDEKQLDTMFLLFISRHGDTDSWLISPQTFVKYLADDVISDPDFKDKLDSDTSKMLPVLKSMCDNIVSQTKYDASGLYDLFDDISGDFDKNIIDILMLAYTSQNNFDGSWTMSLDTLLNYLEDNIVNDESFSSFLGDSFTADIDDMNVQINDAVNQMKGTHYSLLVFNTTLLNESDDTYSFIGDLFDSCSSTLDGDYYLVGNSVMNYEMKNSFNREMLLITILTALAIFLIVVITFRSFIIPAILVLIVMCGVYITVAISGTGDGSIHFLAYIIVQCILMGAAIDYGILYTNYYREYRKRFDIRDAMKAAYDGSIHTILTSGLIMVIVTGIVGFASDDDTLGPICTTLSLGVLSAIILIVVILPGLLSIFDRFTAIRKKQH